MATLDLSVFPAGTVLHDQIAGLLFPTRPVVIDAPVGSLGGARAVSNAHAGEETNPGALEVVFTAPQTAVRLFAGVARVSPIPVQATLHAFDSAGAVVLTDGPVALPQGGAPLRTLLVASAGAALIHRIALSFDRGFAEILGGLEFDVAGPAGPADLDSPTVIIQSPPDGHQVATPSFRLAAAVLEQRQLRAVTVTLDGGGTTSTFGLAFRGAAPDHSVGPVELFGLARGANLVTVRAEDFAGRVGTAAVRVFRAEFAATLVVPALIVAPRGAETRIPVALGEVFPGSLDGRTDIRIEAELRGVVRGRLRIRDALNQPVPGGDLTISLSRHDALGKATVRFRAVEEATSRLIAETAVPISITSAPALVCASGVPLYAEVPLAELTAQLNAGIDATSQLHPLDPMTVEYRTGIIRVTQQYRQQRYLITMSADLRVTLNTESSARVAFDYERFDVNASPPPPQTFINFVPGLRELVYAVGFPLAKSIAEDRFTATFKEPFIRGLETSFNGRLDAERPLARGFLEEVRVRPGEFTLGFCIPPEQFDRL